MATPVVVVPVVVRGAFHQGLRGEREGGQCIVRCGGGALAQGGQHPLAQCVDPRRVGHPQRQHPFLLGAAAARDGQPHQGRAAIEAAVSPVRGDPQRLGVAEPARHVGEADVEPVLVGVGPLMGRTVGKLRAERDQQVVGIEGLVGGAEDEAGQGRVDRDLPDPAGPASQFGGQFGRRLGETQITGDRYASAIEQGRIGPLDSVEGHP